MIIIDIFSLSLWLLSLFFSFIIVFFFVIAIIVSFTIIIFITTIMVNIGLCLFFDN